MSQQYETEGKREGLDIKREGLGHALADNTLVVPRNQRSYDWTIDEVRDLFQDIANAMAESKKEYFLGSIVLTQLPDHVLEIADGQQRLATASILLAAMRDYFLLNNDELP
jgi:uncharacterized protein with ParB-like and HNH nuclease domain